ncbi:hypothetical protein [Streptomyces lydicus]
MSSTLFASGLPWYAILCLAVWKFGRIEEKWSANIRTADQSVD